MNRQKFALTSWLLIFATVLVWSAISPHDRATWWMEVAPALIALIALAWTRKAFPLTPLAYTLILVHSIILMVGGHYTYAEVPLGEWIQQWSGGSRNDYDKLGHLAQGFIPAIVLREVMVRNRVVGRHGWLSLLVVCGCLAFSALYELIEWWVALLSDEAAEAFLGTQGYVWDTQSDMWWALCGAVLALVTLTRMHQRQINRLESAPAG
jgi:putative membrane protein